MNARSRAGGRLLRPGNPSCHYPQAPRSSPDEGVVAGDARSSSALLMQSTLAAAAATAKVLSPHEHFGDKYLRLRSFYFRRTWTNGD